jgi:rhamnulokinase
LESHYLAVDLGAESGRVLLGTVGPERVRAEEIHRFANIPTAVPGSLRWDVLRLLSEIKTGLRLAGARGLTVSGVSVDAWGVDYVLFREGEPLLTLPYHYRDSRTEGVLDKVFARVPAEDIFAATGIQFMPLNTLYQLFLDAQTRPWVLEAADRFLNIGDYFNFQLSGAPKGEATLASTTQLFDPRTGDWAWNLIAKLGLPKKIFPPLVAPGTVLGPLRPELAEESGISGAQVIASCSHDTAAAVAATPGQGEDWAFLSSGTWSLLGVELPAPVITAESRKYNFTNETGFGGTVMFRKNIAGLWIVQECKRAWAAEGRDYGYDALTAQAEAAPPGRRFIRPEDARFLKPGGMPEKIAAYCRETGQPVPESPGETVRCVLESLALLYARTLEECAAVTGRKFRVLHVVGGGAKNALLNRLTAQATRLRVLAGPSAATALGNILVQAHALGRLGGDLRTLVRNSQAPEIFEPENAEAWEPSRRRFQSLGAAA